MRLAVFFVHEGIHSKVVAKGISEAKARFAGNEGKPVGKLPPAINLDAKAGTMVITDGRLLHGTGINHTDKPRIVMLNGM